jgi:tetratricopeptide (TPR) repeat protein
MQKYPSGPIGLLSGIVHLTIRMLLLPVDCLFYLYDFFSVNIRKTGLMNMDCRGPFGCRAAEKYMNKRLFCFICGDFRYDSDEGETACQAEDGIRPQLMRGFMGLATLSMVVAGIVVGAKHLWPGRGFTGAESPQAVKKNVAQLLEKARRASSAERYEEAARLYERAIKLNPGESRLHFELAQVWAREGWEKLALNQYRIAAFRGNDAYATEGAEKAAVMLYRTGKIHSARVFAERALKLESESARMHAIRAEEYLETGRKEAAARLIGRAAELGNKDDIVRVVTARVALARGELDRASAIMRELKAGEAGRLPTYDLCRVRLFSAKGKFNEASEVLNAVIRRFPESPVFRVAQFHLLLMAGRNEDALERLDRMESELELPAPLSLRVAALLCRYGEAGRALSRALKLTNTDDVGPKAHMLAGQIYHERELFVPAARHVQKTLEDSPDHKGALILSGRIASAQGDQAKAEKQLQKALEKDPESAYAHFLLGRTLLAQGDEKMAFTHLARACELDAENGEFRYRYGMALAKSGRVKQAFAELKEAARRMPDPHRVYTWMGILANQQDEHDKAALSYQKAIDAAPDRAGIASCNLARMLLTSRRHIPIALALAYQAHTIGSPALQNRTGRICAKALMALGYGPRTAAALGADGRIREAARELARASAAAKQENGKKNNEEK